MSAADVCRVWAAGALTWIEAVEVLRRRHLADLYACSYRCGILPTRPLAEEAGLQTVVLVPWRWRRYPEWHHHWKRRLRDGGWSEDEIERTARDLAAGIDVASRPYPHGEMWERMQAEGAAFSASIAAPPGRAGPRARRGRRHGADNAAPLPPRRGRRVIPRAVIVRGGLSPVDVTDVLDAAKADPSIDLILQLDDTRLRIRRRTSEGWTFERYSLEVAR